MIQWCERGTGFINEVPLSSQKELVKIGKIQKTWKNKR